MYLPFLIAGGAAGRLKTGRYVRLGNEGQTDDSAPHNKLLNTLVNAMGIQSMWFGLPEGRGGATMRGGIYDDILT
jgi:hypothetical protein